jgi:hypothetical protein
MSTVTYFVINLFIAYFAQFDIVRQAYEFPKKGLRFVWFLCSLYAISFHRTFVSIHFSKQNYVVDIWMYKKERIIVHFSIRQYSGQE